MNGQSRASVSVLGAAIGLALLGPACKRSPKQLPQPGDDVPALGPVVVKPVPAADFRDEKLQIDEEELLAKVKGTLEHAGIFGEPSPRRAALRFSLEVVPTAEGSADAIEMVVKLRLQAASRPEGRAPLHYTDDVAAVGRAPLATRDPKAARAAFQRLAERSAEDLVQSYVARQKLWAAGARQVAEAMRSEDIDQRIEALRVVGGRGLHELAGATLELLDDDDEDVRDAALGALVSLRERGAVKILARSRQMRDVREMRKILDAMAILGGTEAREYLAFVAENHDDEDIRAMAKAALERMTRNGQMKATK